jgi:ribosomal protein S18 acetylase RimI-like enzyme
MIRRISVFSEPHTVLQIAHVYQQAFGYYPWHEGYRCPVCQYVSSLERQAPICPMCSKTDLLVHMVDYWPQGQIITDLYSQMMRDSAVCIGDFSSESLIGFAWGYPFYVSVHTSDYLEAPGLERFVSDTVFYLDECAVLPQHQKAGIGSMLLRHILMVQPYDKLILRTLQDSPMQRLVQSLGGEDLLAISGNRTIMQLIRPDRLRNYIIFPHY